MQSLVMLARVMSKCATRIYKQHHESLLPVWNAANEIRRELHRLVEQQRKDLNFGLVGDPSTGELGYARPRYRPVSASSHRILQSTDRLTLAAVYHHTLLLTFRPFLVLPPKLQHENASAGEAAAANLPTPPPWLDSACEYCLDAARHSIAFLAGASEQNVLCRVRPRPRAAVCGPSWAPIC